VNGNLKFGFGKPDDATFYEALVEYVTPAAALVPEPAAFNLVGWSILAACGILRGRVPCPRLRGHVAAMKIQHAHADESMALKKTGAQCHV
jgi:hypothetical protein